MRDWLDFQPSRRECMQTRILHVIQKALAGSRKIKITLKRDTIYPILHMLVMAGIGMIEIKKVQKIALWNAALSGGWQHDRDRTIIISLAEHFDIGRFQARIGPALEKIELAGGQTLKKTPPDPIKKP